MKRLYRSVLALGFAFTLPLSAMAKDPAAADGTKAKPAASTPATADPSPDYSVVLQQFKAQGVTVTYLGRKYGLDGWLLTKESKIQVVYITPDGQGAVVGTLYGPTGKLETSAQLAEAERKGIVPSSAAPAPAAPASAYNTSPVKSTAEAGATGAATPPAASSSPAPGAAEAAKSGEAPSERLWKQVEASTYIKIGSDNAPPFYVIMDPRCEYCHKLYSTITDKYLPNNSMQLRVIPVGILGPDSLKQAQQIVSSPDMTKVWIEAERYNTSELPPSPAPDAAAKINANHKIMTDWDLKGTPSCIYRGKDGKVKVVVGEPQDMDAIVADLAPAKQ